MAVAEGKVLRVAESCLSARADSLHTVTYDESEHCPIRLRAWPWADGQATVLGAVRETAHAYGGTVRLLRKSNERLCPAATLFALTVYRIARFTICVQGGVFSFVHFDRCV